jgi:rod shape-determining protein MreC
LALLLFFLRGAAIEYMVEKISLLFFPIQKTIYRTATNIKDNYKRFSDYQQFVKESEELKKENLKYSFILEDYRKTKEENNRLRELLDFKKNRQGELKIAEVNFQHPKDIFNEFSVNVGLNDGIEKNMVVTFKNILIGRIEKIYDNDAKVAMITKEGSNLSVLVNNEFLGVVRGEGDAELIYEPSVHFEVDIKENDKIYTSGISDIYPKNIFVGTIDKIIEGEDGSKKYIVEYKLNPFNLSEVIISPGKEKI